MMQIHILKGYAEGYDEDAYSEAMIDKKDIEVEKTQNDQEVPSEEEENTLPFLAAVIAIVGIATISVIHDYFRFRKGRKKNG